MKSQVMPTYARLPVSFTHGEGVWLIDGNGERYLDAISGIGVCQLGHAHPAVRDAISRQAGKLIHTSNLYGIENQEKLAGKLITLSGLDNVFFSNSGAEANEAAIKISRLYGHQRGIKKPAVIVMENSFHGRTLATLSATGNPKVQKGFEPLTEGFMRVPFDNIERVSDIRDSSVVGVLVEPIQGEGGVNIPASDYLPRLRELCDQRGWLLMLDEVQTGIGRTGMYFAYQYADIMPDVCTLAKGLGNGLPIGACLARGEAAATLTAGTHGSTFGGNPLVCSAALAVLDILEKEHLVQRAEALGQKLLESFREKLKDNPSVIDIRGRGLMIAIDLDEPCGELVSKALEQRILINVTAANTIRLLPPLILSDEEAQILVNKVTSLIQ
ncbi:MAG: aspartate aminotransferase family protein [Methylococcales bacterium]